MITEQDDDFQAKARENFALTIFNSMGEHMLPDAELVTARPQLRDYVVMRLAAWRPALVDPVRL
ncbi:MAG: hypothetical protein JOZ47_18320 [Kutzneria sp.]|nr:hypothetical protein [Kutzneria sp.]